MLGRRLRLRARARASGGLALLLAACGGAAAPAPRTPRAQATTPQVAAAAEPRAPEPPPATKTVQVRGLTGTLNKDDVHQTMEARQPELDACIAKVRRREAYVHGAIRFGFAVDASGRVAELRTLSSDIGHYELERCIQDVVLATEFPAPDGDATARFDWGMEVLGAYEPSEALDASRLTRMLAQRGVRLREHCKIKRARGRARTQVTLYVGRRGRVLSVGMVPAVPLDEEQTSCALAELRELRMPKQKRRAKLTFALR